MSAAVRRSCISRALDREGAGSRAAWRGDDRGRRRRRRPRPIAVPTQQLDACERPRERASACASPVPARAVDVGRVRRRGIRARGVDDAARRRSTRRSVRQLASRCLAADGGGHAARSRLAALARDCEPVVAGRRGGAHADVAEARRSREWLARWRSCASCACISATERVGCAGRAATWRFDATGRRCSDSTPAMPTAISVSISGEAAAARDGRRTWRRRRRGRAWSVSVRGSAGAHSPARRGRACTSAPGP